MDWRHGTRFYLLLSVAAGALVLMSSAVLLTDPNDSSAADPSTVIDGIEYTIDPMQGAIVSGYTPDISPTPTALSQIEYEGKFYPVGSIGNNAFSGCTSLVSVGLPDSVTSIGSNAFSGCTSLVSVGLPDMTPATVSLMGIGSSAFSGCTAFKGFGPGQTVGGGPGTLSIPVSIGNIGDFAFEGCTSITGLELVGSPDLGKGVFRGCTGISSISVGSNSNFSVDSDGGYLRRDTTLWLVPAARPATEIELSDCGTIAPYAFSGASKLTRIVIGPGVNQIGEAGSEAETFSGCTSLRSFEVDQGNGEYASSSEGDLVSKDGNDLFYVVGGAAGSEKMFSQRITHITPCAFKDTAFAKIIFNDASGIASLDRGAFTVGDPGALTGGLYLLGLPDNVACSGDPFEGCGAIGVYGAKYGMFDASQAEVTYHYRAEYDPGIRGYGPEQFWFRVGSEQYTYITADTAGAEVFGALLSGWYEYEHSGPEFDYSQNPVGSVSPGDAVVSSSCYLYFRAMWIPDPDVKVCPVFHIPSGSGVTVLAADSVDTDTSYTFTLVYEYDEVEVTVYVDGQVLDSHSEDTYGRPQYRVDGIQSDTEVTVEALFMIEDNPLAIGYGVELHPSSMAVMYGEAVTATFPCSLPGAKVLVSYRTAEGTVTKLLEAGEEVVIEDMRRAPRFHAEAVYGVDLPQGPGYVVGGGRYAGHGEDYLFTVTAYHNFPGSPVVKAGGKVLRPETVSGGVYGFRVPDVESDLRVEVLGGLPATLRPGEGYVLEGPDSVCSGDDYGFILRVLPGFDPSRMEVRNNRDILVPDSVDGLVYTYRITGVSGRVDVSVLGLEPEEYRLGTDFRIPCDGTPDGYSLGECDQVAHVGKDYRFRIIPASDFDGTIVATVGGNRIVLVPEKDGEVLVYTVPKVSEVPDIRIYAGFAVVPAEGQGYRMTDFASAVEAGGTFTFRIVIDEAYDGSDMVVRNRGEQLAPVFSDGAYGFTVPNVSQAPEITVKGVVPRPIPVNFSNCLHFRLSGEPFFKAGGDYSFEVTAEGDTSYDPVVSVNGEIVGGRTGVYTVKGAESGLDIAVDIGFAMDPPSRGGCRVEGAPAVYAGGSYTFTVSGLAEGHSVYWNGTEVASSDGEYTVDNVDSPADLYIRDGWSRPSLAAGAAIAAAGASVIALLVAAVRSGFLVIV